MAHTPGPWVVNPFEARVDEAAKICDDGLLPICKLLWPTDERTETETKANARLIAAAPAMLEALQGLLGLYDETHWGDLPTGNHPSAIARAAIALATGDE